MVHNAFFICTYANMQKSIKMHRTHKKAIISMVFNVLSLESPSLEIAFNPSKDPAFAYIEGLKCESWSYSLMAGLLSFNKQ